MIRRACSHYRRCCFLSFSPSAAAGGVPLSFPFFFAVWCAAFCGGGSLASLITALSLACQPDLSAGFLSFGVAGAVGGRAAILSCWWFTLPVATRHSIKIAGAIVGLGESGYRFWRKWLSAKKFWVEVAPFRKTAAGRVMAPRCYCY